jgi:N-acetylglucosamine-6-sulfatase
MRGHTIVLAVVVVMIALLPTASTSRALVPDRPNVVIIIMDDQRWDLVTPELMPNTWNELVTTSDQRFPSATSETFANAFVPNPLCCPSRTSILTGNYSHTTGVWDNGKDGSPYGGFAAFDDEDTIAVDFDNAGYRTAMIGKYLNGYIAGKYRYVPPGWDRWFTVEGGAYYHYGATADHARLHFGGEAEDYSTRVLSHRAVQFVTDAQQVGAPFFLYYSFIAPHAPAIPDERDVGRFDGYDTGTPIVRTDMLETAYGADRAVGRLLEALPANTIVVFLSDNGYLLGEHDLTGKLWPYDESIRIPLVITSLDGSFVPAASEGDLVLNVDLRATLTHAARVPSTSSEGLDWGASDYVARSVFPIEHYGGPDSEVLSYCGVREKRWMYARMSDGTEFLFDEITDPSEDSNVAGDQAFDAKRLQLRDAAMSLCFPTPPGYSW